MWFLNADSGGFINSDCFLLLRQLLGISPCYGSFIMAVLLELVSVYEVLESSV